MKENKEKYIEAFKKSIKNSSELSDPEKYMPGVRIDYKSKYLNIFGIYLMRNSNKLEVIFLNSRVNSSKFIELTEAECRELLDIYTEKFNALNEIKIKEINSLETQLDDAIEEYLNEK